jgi:hypothetical protein
LNVSESSPSTLKAVTALNMRVISSGGVGSTCQTPERSGFGICCISALALEAACPIRNQNFELLSEATPLVPVRHQETVRATRCGRAKTDSPRHRLFQSNRKQIVNEPAGRQKAVIAA